MGIHIQATGQFGGGGGSGAHCVVSLPTVDEIDIITYTRSHGTRLGDPTAIFSEGIS
jgi:hypothetical protein